MVGSTGCQAPPLVLGLGSVYSPSPLLHPRVEGGAPWSQSGPCALDIRANLGTLHPMRRPQHEGPHRRLRRTLCMSLGFGCSHTGSHTSLPPGISRSQALLTPSSGPARGRGGTTLNTPFEPSVLAFVSSIFGLWMSPEEVFALQGPRGSAAGAGSSPACCVSLAHHCMSWGLSLSHMSVVCPAGTTCGE